MKQYNIIENKSRRYPNGSIWNSNSCGQFTIIGKTDRCNAKKSYIYCLCKFEDGAIIEADFTNIKIGNVKSPNHPVVYGVGYIGQGKWRSKIKGKTAKEYSIWLHMMGRCYSKTVQTDNPSYKGVTVSAQWHCFQKFCEDIQHLDGYGEWKTGSKYELDKDILCGKMNINPKIYSPETCMFISKYNNVSESTSRKNLTGLTYIATSPDSKEYEFTNQQDFAIKHGLNCGLVSACINKTRKHHKGWTFKISL